MKKIKLIIDIDEDLYKGICEFKAKDEQNADRLNECELLIADGKPLQIGHWTKRDVDFNGRVWHNCSVCNGVATTRADKDDFFNFCPHCGAKMERD